MSGERRVHAPDVRAMTRPDIPLPAQAYFDGALGAWVLTRYADVRAALREPRLTASGARGGAELWLADHLRFRAEASAAVAEILENWLPRLEPEARNMARALPGNRPVDLVGEFARPWSVQMACSLARAGGDTERMTARAAEIFVAAAEPREEILQSRAEGSTRELAGAFSGALTAFYVQAFVALSQTLPCFLANAWLALLNDAGSTAMLRAEPELIPEAIEELLRYSGPSRAVFRCATADVPWGGAMIAKGDRVALMLAAANRDPEQFPEPDRLNFRRGPICHLALGAGKHACVGARLVRAASAAATAVFLETYAGARLDQPVEWRGGFAICAPASLLVSRSSDS
jgi:cytochrome P450